MGNQLKNATDLAVSTLRLAFSEELAGGPTGWCCSRCYNLTPIC